MSSEYRSVKYTDPWRSYLKWQIRETNSSYSQGTQWSQSSYSSIERDWSCWCGSDNTTARWVHFCWTGRGADESCAVGVGFAV